MFALLEHILTLFQVQLPDVGLPRFITGNPGVMAKIGAVLKAIYYQGLFNGFVLGWLIRDVLVKRKD